MPIFKGAGVAIVTPMKENLEVNYELLERNINYQIDNGTDAIIIAGTTGESATLSEEEHKKVVKAPLSLQNTVFRSLQEPVLTVRRQPSSFLRKLTKTVQMLF